MNVQNGFDGHTTHYSCDKGYDAMQVIEDFDLNFRLGNAIKYILRCGKKGDLNDSINDLKKAIAYLNREIYLLSSKNNLMLEESKDANNGNNNMDFKRQ